MTTPRVLALYDDWDGCLHWRIVRPFETLAASGYKYAAYAQLREVGPERYAHMFDALILPRLSWADHGAARNFIDAAHRAGLAVILEVDDDLFSENVSVRIQQTVEQTATLEELEQKRLDRLAAMRMCDGITVSSKRLATTMRTLTDRPVCLVPNAIDTKYWRDQLRGRRRQIPGPTIGWAGGSRPDDDLEPMASAWGRVARRYPAVTFVVYGFQPPVIDRYVPAERIVRVAWQSIDNYPLPFRDIDIGCAAVADNPFNRCKTPIKVWEYTLGGAATVATPALYGPTIDNGTDGLLAQTADDWEFALGCLVSLPAYRRELQRNQRRRVASEHSLAVNLWRWPAAWTAIVADFRARRGRLLVAS